MCHSAYCWLSSTKLYAQYSTVHLHRSAYAARSTAAAVLTNVCGSQRMKDDGGGRKQGVTVRFVRLRRHALLLPYRSFFRIGNESSRTEKQELRTESEVDVIIPGGAVAIEKVLNPLVGADTGRV